MILTCAPGFFPELNQGAHPSGMQGYGRRSQEKGIMMMTTCIWKTYQRVTYTIYSLPGGPVFSLNK